MLFRHTFLRELHQVQLRHRPELDEMSCQDPIVMQNDLLGSQLLAVPCAVAIADERYVEAQAAGAPAGRVDTKFRLRSSDDQAPNICRSQLAVRSR